MTTITIDREKAKQAMEMLDVSQALLERSRHHTKILAAYEALRAALAAQPQILDEAMEVPKAMAQAYENGYNAALANGPAWHDAPTVPGLWLSNLTAQARQISAWNVESRTFAEPGTRWFGPIPEDTK